MITDPDEFTFIQSSMFASFNNINSELVYWCVVPMLLCGAYLMRIAHKLDVMWLGVDNAKSLGVDTHKLTMQSHVHHHFDGVYLDRIDWSNLVLWSDCRGSDSPNLHWLPTSLIEL